MKTIFLVILALVLGHGASAQTIAGTTEKASNSQLGIVQGDGQTFTINASGIGSITTRNRTAIINTSISASDMGGQVNMNVSGGGTVTFPAISGTVFTAGMTVVVNNFNPSSSTISTTPTINGFSGTSIPQYGGISCVSNGTSLDCVGLGVLGNQVTLNGTGQVLIGGVHPTVFSNGTVSSGIKTIDCGNNPIQSLTNGGAFTFAISANDGQCTVRVTNNGSAGAITFSGFSEGSNTGDALDSTNAHVFDITLSRIGGNPHYLVSALQ
jgi:hypothetical protein